jgi:hypothetical protein
MLPKENPGTWLLSTIQQTNNLLMNIVNTPKDKEVIKQCEETIFMLTKKYKVLGRCPQCNSFAE